MGRYSRSLEHGYSRGLGQSGRHATEGDAPQASDGARIRTSSSTGAVEATSGLNGPGEAEEQWIDEADFNGYSTNGFTCLPEIARDEGEDTIEDRLTAAEGISEGVRRHVLVGDPEAEFERFMATMREAGEAENRQEETMGQRHRMRRTRRTLDEAVFPPLPPGPRGEEGEHAGGLLDFVKRRNKGGEQMKKETKVTRAVEPRQQPLGVPHRHEGKPWMRTSRKRRQDLPEAPREPREGDQGPKWRKALHTARLFRANKNRKTHTVEKLKKGYYANSSRRAKMSVRRTIENILRSLGVRGKDSCWSLETLEQVGAVLKESNYKAGVTYLSEYKQLLIESGTIWSHQLQKAYGQVARALKRAKGPTKKAAEVGELTWMVAMKKEINEEAKGVVHNPALLFAFATMWMLREVELAVHKGDILVDAKERIVALTLRVAKKDQECLGSKRTLQCCCSGECDWSEPCPYRITCAALDAVPIEEEKLVHGDLEEPVSKSQIIAAWRSLFGQQVSGHSGRRSGALQYIRRGWQVPQVGYLGRWKSNVILQYAEEALETMPVMTNPHKKLKGRGEDEPKKKDIEMTTTEPKEWTKIRETEHKLRKEITHLKVAQEKLEESMERWETISKRHHGLLPPVVISKMGVIHANKKQPVASPVLSWHTKCGWFFGCSIFSSSAAPSSVLPWMTRRSRV